MKIRIGLALISVAVLSGCAATVNLATPEASTQAKQFARPAAGKAGLYVFRDSSFGHALKKDVWVNGRCLGESAPRTFFFTEVAGNTRHKVETASEFSPNALEVPVQSGRNYFVRQYIKLGVFVGGANLELVPEDQGKAAIAGLELAQPGTCALATPSTPAAK